jgi:hypothetical protein
VNGKAKAGTPSRFRSKLQVDLAMRIDRRMSAHLQALVTRGWLKTCEL